MPPVVHSRCIEIMLKALGDSEFIKKGEENSTIVCEDEGQGQGSQLCYELPYTTLEFEI